MATTRWDEIDGIIAEHKDHLKAAETHHVLKDFADEHGLMNKSDFGKFKHLLKKIGINYNDLRDKTFAADDARRAEELDNLGDDAAHLTLWSAAIDHDDEGAFAIVDDTHEAVWYGKFFDDDRHYTAGDLVSAEQSVAHKTVWIASKALAAAGEDTGRLTLVTTCPHLDTDALAADGARLGVAVDVEVNDNDERAVTMAETPGFKSWKDTDLSTLVESDD